MEQPIKVGDKYRVYGVNCVVVQINGDTVCLETEYPIDGSIRGFVRSISELWYKVI